MFRITSATRAILPRLTLASIVCSYLCVGAYVLLWMESTDGLAMEAAGTRPMDALQLPSTQILDNCTAWMLTAQILSMTLAQQANQRMSECPRLEVPITSYPDAVHYCVGVLSTIGYSNVRLYNPSSDWFVAVYSLLGIPLLFFLLLDIAATLHRFIHFLASSITRGYNAFWMHAFLLLLMVSVYLLPGTYLILKLGQAQTISSAARVLVLRMVSTGTFSLQGTARLGHLAHIAITAYSMLGLVIWLTVAYGLSYLFQKFHYSGQGVERAQQHDVWLGGMRINLGRLIARTLRDAGVESEVVTLSLNHLDSILNRYPYELTNGRTSRLYGRGVFSPSLRIKRLFAGRNFDIPGLRYIDSNMTPTPKIASSVRNVSQTTPLSVEHTPKTSTSTAGPLHITVSY